MVGCCEELKGNEFPHGNYSERTDQTFQVPCTIVPLNATINAMVQVVKRTKNP